MKNNRDKLSEAFEGLRGDTLGSVLSAMDTPIANRKNKFSRPITWAAACLAAVMMVGAVMTVPFLTSDEPTVPSTDRVSGTDFVVVAPGEKYPFVRVQALTARTESDGETENDDVSVDTEYGHIMLTFNCDEGESVEIISHKVITPQSLTSEKLAEVFMKIDNEGLNMTLLQTLERILIRELRSLEPNPEESETALAPWVPERAITQLQDEVFLISKRFLLGTTPYDVVDFLIRNENGEIVGGGSVCVSVKKLYSSYMVRHEILDSKRFDMPIPEDEAAAYIDGLHENLETVIESMDFAPATAEEGYEIAKTDIVMTCFGNGQVIHAVDSLWTNSAPFWEFRILKIRGRAQEEERFFVSFPDGTWGEISEDGGWVDEPCTDESCTASEEPHDHRTERTLVLTDGRIVSIERQCYVDENGRVQEKYVPVFVPAAETA